MVEKCCHQSVPQASPDIPVWCSGPQMNQQLLLARVEKQESILQKPVFEMWVSSTPSQPLRTALMVLLHFTTSCHCVYNLKLRWPHLNEWIIQFGMCRVMGNKKNWSVLQPPTDIRVKVSPYLATVLPKSAISFFSFFGIKWYLIEQRTIQF